MVVVFLSFSYFGFNLNRSFYFPFYSCYQVVPVLDII